VRFFAVVPLPLLVTMSRERDAWLFRQLPVARQSLLLARVPRAPIG